MMSAKVNETEISLGKMCEKNGSFGLFDCIQGKGTYDNMCAAFQWKLCVNIYG